MYSALEDYCLKDMVYFLQQKTDLIALNLNIDKISLKGETVNIKFITDECSTDSMEEEFVN